MLESHCVSYLLWILYFVLANTRIIWLPIDRDSSSFVVPRGQNEIHLDEIRRLRKSAQEQAIRVSSLNKLLDERSERIRQLEAERYSASASSALPSAAGGLAGAHAYPAGGCGSDTGAGAGGEVERLRSRHQELIARVLELERQLNEKVHSHSMSMGHTWLTGERSAIDLRCASDSFVMHAGRSLVL